MQEVERGFEVFIGETIIKVDTSAINVTHFHCQSGKVVSVDAECVHHGIYCPQVSDGYNVEPIKQDWQTLVPTHTDGWSRYAKMGGKWYCFFSEWEYATNQHDKFFESGYKPDDNLKPL